MGFHKGWEWGKSPGDGPQEPQCELSPGGVPLECARGHMVCTVVTLTVKFRLTQISCTDLQCSSSGWCGDICGSIHSTCMCHWDVTR
jgi:hypothetical protein